MDDLVPLGNDDAVRQMALAAILVAMRWDAGMIRRALPPELPHPESTAIRSAAVLDLATAEAQPRVTARRSAALGEGGVDHVGFDCLDIRVAD